MCRPDLGGKFLRSPIGRGLCRGPQIEIIIKFPKAAQPHFSPISSPFWVQVGVRVRVRVRERGWVGSVRRVQAWMP